ncbi:MAG: DUF1592 domain-containing protein [Pirellulaceae bacterium]
MKAWESRRLSLFAASLLWLLSSAGRSEAADVYAERIEPFTRKYCNDCHNRQQARGELDLTRYAQASDVTADFRRWNHIIEFVRNGEMPPEDAEQQPTLEQRNEVVDAVQAILLEEARKHAGDPGVILPRRLSNTEFDLSVRDLTGVDIRPTRDFPPDPAAGEGFDNTGEALSMSPSLLKKYLAAAQEVSSHLVLKTDGVEFAPFPVNSYSERKKLTEQAIIDFYEQHEVRIADYLEAAWRYRHRTDAEGGLSIEAWAQRRDLSGKYLALVWRTLLEAPSSSGYLQRVGELWEAIPAPAAGGEIPEELSVLNRYVEFCRRLLCHQEGQLIRSNAGNWPISHLDFRAAAAKQRDRFDPSRFSSRRLLVFDRLKAPGRADKERKGLSLYLRVDPAVGGGSGDCVLLHRPLFSTSNKLPRNAEEEEKHEIVTLRELLKQHAPQLADKLSFGLHPQGGKIAPDALIVKAPALIEIPLSPELLERLDGKQLLVECELDPAADRKGSVYVQASSGEPPEDLYAENVELLLHPESRSAQEVAQTAERFCNTFPNRFFYVDDRRGLAAGFHLVEGFFRDDQPLCEKVLSDKQRAQLDRLWQELHFATNSAETLLRGFVWFERSERHVLHDERFDFLRSEDPRLVKDELLDRFERVYLEKMGVKLVEDSLAPEQPNDRFDMIHGFFQRIRRDLARHRELTRHAEEAALRDLQALAERAYRRALRDGEAESLEALYHTLRRQGQGVEDALRGVFTAILMAPDFCYRIDEAPPGSSVYPLSNDALASRLSYFLWSSSPDDELLAVARDGGLQDEATLLAQTMRMTKSPKIEAFAREFFSQWLRFRDYLEKDPINADAFPGYSDPLRQAMFEEPARFATYLIQQDRPIIDLLNSDATFVNGVLARHYGGEIARQYKDQTAKWIEDSKRNGIPLEGDPEQKWRRVEGLRTAGRGGLFGMGVILTKNSSGERTSPVKRGFWTVHHLLGQHFPPPPADVPELPRNEKDAPQTIRELLVQHTANPRCAMCHTHFDGLGMALEGFDPIGRARTKDLAGRPIDDVAQLPDGNSAQGIPGLIDYVETHRRQDFVRTLCRKFLGYALGRSVMLSDQPLLAEMEAALEQNDYRFSVLFETVVRSPQFRKQRGRQFTTASR